MKRILILLFIIIFSLVGCGKETEEQISIEETTLFDEQIAEYETEYEISAEETEVAEEIKVISAESLVAEEENENQKSIEVISDTIEVQEPATVSQESNSNNELKLQEVIDSEETPKVEAEQKATEFVAYSPERVAAQATEKTKAFGKVTLTDNLIALLNNGAITQEQFDSYYPYDGAGYYSVFVETNLKEAKTTSGRLLETEEGIALYLAELLSLENGPYFLIEYVGIYSTGGTDFYEFRCYRA